MVENSLLLLIIHSKDKFYNLQKTYILIVWKIMKIKLIDSLKVKNYGKDFT
jgi:hypothetical protein